ncbi:HugZ family protein [Pseudoalteromonas mariniglutinosa]|uniref:HugZ family pyridoxamine 5'-phosphate oxidase n=1 Tax=Pseudoalteromonas mariniglutinosa TaxID=206042 RepID=UPI00384A84DA
MRQHALHAAQKLVFKKSSGVMSTLSYNLRGYPFGSVTPYMCDEQGRIYFFISDIAQHTKNLQHDKRMSLTVYDEATQGDQNEQGRVTIVGDGSMVNAQQSDVLIDKYVALYPEAASYRQAHDFKLWQLDPIRVRYIGGFGKIFWLEQKEWQTTIKNWDDNQELAMIEHMNKDHQDVMSAILKQHTDIDESKPIMSGLLPTGCYIQAQQRNFYIAFDARCDSPTAVRQALVSLSKKARSAA